MAQEHTVQHLQAENTYLKLQLAESQRKNFGLEERLATLTQHSVEVVTGDLTGLRVASGTHHASAGASDRQQLQLQFQQLQMDYCKVCKDLSEVRNQLELTRHENAIYKEDFTKERQDRENTHEQLLRTRQELARTKEELAATSELLSQYNQQNCNDARLRRQAAMQRIRDEYYHNHPEPAVPAGFRGRGHGIVAADGVDDNDEDEDIIDSLQEPNEDVDNSSDHGDGLQCPFCRASFPMEQHHDFLEHVDICTDQ